MKRDDNRGVAVPIAALCLILFVSGIFCASAALGSLRGYCLATPNCWCDGYLDADGDNYVVSVSPPSFESPIVFTFASVSTCESSCTESYCGSAYPAESSTHYSNSLAGLDCNDSNLAINPGHAEVCGNGIDDNCSGQTDEGCNAVPVIAQGTSLSVTMDEDGSPTAWSPPTISATDANGGDTLTWSKDSGPSHGTADVSGSGSSPSSPTVLSYTPTADYYGTDSFVVKVSDGIATDTITVNVTITAVNDAGPLITESDPVEVTMSEDGSPIAFSLTLNATDFDNDTLTWDIPYPAGEGTAAASGTGTSKAVTYTPDADYNGTDSFVVGVFDQSLVDTITVNVTVNAVNDAAVITAQNTLSTNEDTALTIILEDLNVSDVDNTYPDDFSLTVSSGSNYTVSGTDVIPAADFNGTLTVPVKVNDGGLDSNTYNLTVTVNAINDAPSFTASDPPAADEDSGAQTVNGWASGFDPGPSDESGQSLVSYTVSNVSDSTFFSAGPSVDTSGNLTYTPAANAYGTPTFDVTVKDSGTTADGGIDTSAVQTFAITVNALDDAPVITGQAALSLYEDTALTIVLGNLIISDVDHTYPAGFSLTVQSGAGYTVSGNTIIPPANYNGALTVPVKVNDGGFDSNIYNLSVTVNAVNDAPAITAQAAALSTNEDSAVAVALSNLTVSDIDSGSFSLTIHSGSNYTVSGNTITPSANFNGTLTVPVSVNDGSADSNVFNLSVTVSPADDPPTVVKPVADMTVNEDAPDTLIDLSAVFGDIDSNVSSIVKTLVSNSNSSLLSAEIAGNMLTLKYLANQNGAATITVRGTVDGKSADVSFKVTVSAVDDAPVPIPAGISAVKAVAGDPPKTLNLSEFFTDIDNDIAAMTFSATSSNAPLIGASVSGNILTLTFPADRIGDALITVTASSGGKTASYEFPVTVNPKGYKASGKVSYFSNSIGVPGVKMTLTGVNFYTGKTDTYTAQTGADGTYLFPDVIRGEYTLTPARNESPNPPNLTATDASEIVDAALGLKVLTALQFRAADVTGNGKLSGLDASRLTRFATGQIAEMSNTGSPAPAWQFEPDSLTLSLNADTAAANFAASLTGDVSGNYRPGTPAKTARDTADTALLKVRQGDMLSVPLVLAEETLIRGIDIQIEYDADMLMLSDVGLRGGILENENYEFVANSTEPGVIRIAIFSLSSLTAVTGSGTVLTADFAVTGPKEVSGLRLERFDCNEIPVSASQPRNSSSESEELTGGFYVNGSLFREASVRTEIDYDLNLYDLTGDGRIGLEDAVQALQEGDLKTAIRALQCVTGM